MPSGFLFLSNTLCIFPIHIGKKPPTPANVLNISCRGSTRHGSRGRRSRRRRHSTKRRRNGNSNVNTSVACRPLPTARSARGRTSLRGGWVELSPWKDKSKRWVGRLSPWKDKSKRWVGRLSPWKDKSKRWVGHAQSMEGQV